VFSLPSDAGCAVPQERIPERERHQAETTHLQSAAHRHRIRHIDYTSTHTYTCAINELRASYFYFLVRDAEEWNLLPASTSSALADLSRAGYESQFPGPPWESGACSRGIASLSKNTRTTVTVAHLK